MSKKEELDNKVKFKQPLAVMNDGDLAAAEQYRVLYTRLEQISVANSQKVFAITSAVKGEGKTVTTLNLAYVAAKEFGKKIILVECDLRNPSISAGRLNKLQKHGLVGVLRGGVDPRDALVQMEGTRLYILPAVHEVKNSSGLLGSRRMNVLINALKAEFDYVFLDSPPILPIADVNILARLADGLLLVVRAGKTPKDIVKKAVNSLSDANIAGIVLNGADRLMEKYYGDYGSY